jgi:hypothetical protein
LDSKVAEVTRAAKPVSIQKQLDFRKVKNYLAELGIEPTKHKNLIGGSRQRLKIRGIDRDYVTTATEALAPDQSVKACDLGGTPACATALPVDMRQRKRPRTDPVAAVGAHGAEVEVLAPRTTDAPNAVVPKEAPPAPPEPENALPEPERAPAEPEDLSVVKQERDAATQRANAAEDRLECCVCQDAVYQVMLGPCRHLCCCATCAPALTECPICRTPVESRTTVFF